MPVRKMEEKDKAEVQKMAAELWPESQDLYEFKDEEVFIWEKEDGSLGGFVSVSIRPWVDGSDSEPCPHIEGWYVKKELRRQGIGQSLIEAIEKWAKERGFDEITSDAEFDNKDSLEAHNSLGFEKTELIQYFKKKL